MTTKARLARRLGLDQFRSRLDFGAVVLAPYVLTLVWQYDWLIQNQTLARILAAVISVAVWYVYVAGEEPDKEKVPRSFWLLVGLPLLIFYLLRVALPDTSFDGLNYHLMHAERALRGPLFIKGDFFPTQFPFNPAPDILTGFYRHLLGYRLGTLSNYFALVWLGVILYRLLRSYLPSSWVRCAAVFAILLTEQILFQINNYMIDLLALPLMVEATRLAIQAGRDAEPPRVIRLALLIGASSAFKLSNLIFAIPIVLVFLENVLMPADRARLRKRILSHWKAFAVAVPAFALPFAAFPFYLYRVTGSPVFPLYNAVFKSPYWPRSNVLDPRWGPHGLQETLLWPVTSFFNPDRISEIPVYSGRIAIGSILAIVCLLLPRGDRRVRGLCFITLAGAILWSTTSGYIRYALYLEVLSGIIVIWLACYIRQQSTRFPSAARLALQVPLACLLLAQTLGAVKYATSYEWSQRPTAFSAFSTHLEESKQMLRDRSLPAYLSDEDRAKLNDVDVWVETTFKTTALYVLLKPAAPVIGVRIAEHFASPQSRRTFAETLQALEGKRLFTLTYAADLENARQALTACGLAAGEPRNISIPYFSDSLKFDMLLVEVLPVWQTDKSKTRETPRDQPLPFLAFDAGLAVTQSIPTLHPGETFTVQVRLTNQSTVPWPGKQPQWKYQLTVGNVWINERGVKLTEAQSRALLSQDLAPGESAELTLKLTAPSQPGNYTLELDAVQEGVAWFGDMGSQLLDLKIKVE